MNVDRILFVDWLSTKVVGGIPSQRFSCRSSHKNTTHIIVVISLPNHSDFCSINQIGIFSLVFCPNASDIKLAIL